MYNIKSKTININDKILIVDINYWQGLSRDHRHCSSFFSFSYSDFFEQIKYCKYFFFFFRLTNCLIEKSSCDLIMSKERKKKKNSNEF